MRLKLISSVLVVTAIAVITGCSSSSSSSTPPVVTVTASAASATVLPGATDQFSAVVANSTSGVTWSIPSGSQGSIDATTGLYTAPNPVTAPGALTVTATLTSDSTKTGTAVVKVLQLTALAISPRSPAIAVAGTEPFTASGSFTDGTNTSTSDWTSESTWASSNTAVATIAGSTATGVAVGVTNITATDTASSTVSPTAVLDVTTMTMTNAALTGHYVFSTTHAGTRGQGFATGSFQADGAGNISGGVVDFNAPQGSASGVAISSGSYTVYPDGRGTLTIAAQGTDNYNFILSSDGSHGSLILSDTTGVVVGSFQKQTVANLAAGNYALLLGGMDGTLLSGSVQNSEVLAGQFTASGGTFSNGIMDVNDAATIDGTACGVPPAACPPPAASWNFSATYSGSVDSNGRGTLQLTPPAGIPAAQIPSSGFWTFAYYVVSANKIVLIQSDVQGTPTSTSPTVAALTGTAELQSAGLADPNGSSYVSLLERSAAEGLFGSAGEWQFLPSNKLTGEMDINGTGKISVANSTYTIDTTTGRGTVAVSTSRSYVFYLISTAAGAGKMYVLEADNKVNAGVGQQQTTVATLPTGSLAFNISQLATNGYDSSFVGQITVGAGGLSGIADSNVAVNYVETPASNTLTGTSFGAPDGLGRGAFTLTFQNVPGSGLSTGYAFYLVSPTEMVVFGTSSNQAGFQPQDGTIQVQ